ncbi:MAG: MXAN_6640 family putative metalloprotease, partial [Myxococcota bacterium]
MFRALYLAMLAGCAWLSAGCDPEGFPVTAQHVQRGLRPTEPGASSPSYPVGTSLESFALPNGSFRVHFTRGGTHGVPESGTEPPTSVVAVAEVYEAALQHYIDNLGYRRPVSDRGEGGDDLIDVYMIDFGGRGDGAFVIDACEGPGGPCAGHIRHENDFRGYSYPSTRVANRILSSHELFHAVQAAYTVGQTVVLTEGSAVWATENFDGELADFEGFIDGYLTDTGRSLTFDGGVFDGFGYGTGVFFQFLAEWDHPDVIRALWQARADSLETKWLATLDEVLRERGRSFEE